MRRWLWPSLSQQGIDRELQIACRGIVVLLGVSVFLYFLFGGMPRTLTDGLMDLVAAFAIVMLVLAIRRKSLICAAGLFLIFAYDAVRHLEAGGNALGFVLDFGLLYFSLRALRAANRRGPPALPYAPTPTN